MVDFAALLHVRTAPGSESRKKGFKGGYGWFLGRFDSWEAFLNRLASHLEEVGYQIIEVDDSFEITGPGDLNAGEQQELFELLDAFPLQYRTLHLYRNDDA